MLIIDGDGEYQYEEGTRTPRQSDHPVWEARIELALGQGTWLYAPAAGHDLAKYNREKQTRAKNDEFQKDLGLYLERYSPKVQEILGQRGAVSLSLEISEEALDAERI